ncbi:signal recognition particle protein Srp19 [Candidatus Bathyarchaeota archaeon]|nr:signal recognition particle protein Srp19 [Candidatus Bathyarchaeota archaeon]
MRKQDKIILWPAYFDSTRTRKEGRQIPKSLAVPLPKILEVKDAAERLGLKCELVENAGYSKTPWLKTGMLLVKKNEAKDKTIKKIAKQLIKIRSVNLKKD